jgi:membrane protease YdiL (CAAX protease family)
MLKWRVIKDVLLRLLVASAAIVSAILLVRFLLLPALVALFHPGDEVTSLLRRTGMFVFILFAYWAYVRHYEKRSATELRFAPLGIAAGAASGALLITIATALLFAFGVYEVTIWRGPQGGLLGAAGLILVAAFLEEITYRALLFQILEKAWGTHAALWIQALIFAAEHLLNAPASTPELVTWMLSVTLLGLFWGGVFVLSRNIWVVTANHAAWNFALILTGLPLSGIEDWRVLAPIQSQYNGPPWLTGGVFGPENSIVAIVLMGIATVALLALGKRRQRFVAAAP